MQNIPKADIFEGKENIPPTSMLTTPSKPRIIFLGITHFSLFLLLIATCVLGACESKPKTKEILLTYLVKDGTMHYNRESGSSLLGVYPKFQVSATVTNTSDYGGVFKFYANVSSQGRTLNFSEEQYLASGQTVTFSRVKEIDHYSFQTDVSIDSWGIVPPSKTITIGD